MLNVTNLQAFQKSIRNFAEKTRQAPVTVAKKLILELSRQTILLTPVDTGRLVGGWQVSGGDRPVVFNLGESNPSEAHKKAEESTLQLKPEQGIFWLANNVDYARHQEYGSARNRGKFMLQTALTSVQARADKLAKEAMSE